MASPHIPCHFIMRRAQLAPETLPGRVSKQSFRKVLYFGGGVSYPTVNVEVSRHVFLYPTLILP